MATGFGGKDGVDRHGEETWEREISTRGITLITDTLDLLHCEDPLKRAGVISTSNNMVRLGGRTYVDIASMLKTFGVDRFLKMARSASGLIEAVKVEDEAPPKSQTSELLDRMKLMRQRVDNTLKDGANPVKASPGGYSVIMSERDFKKR